MGINRRYVITAAHCTRNEIKEVVLGDWDLEHDPDCEGYLDGCDYSLEIEAQRFRVNRSNVIVHKNWDKNHLEDKGNDIALIRLPRLAITYNEDPDQIVNPACLGWDRTIQVPD